MAKPNTGFNFTFGTPSTPGQPQQPQQQPAGTSGQLQLPSFSFGQQTAAKPATTATAGISFGAGATSTPSISFGAGSAAGGGISLGIAAPTAPAAITTAPSNQSAFGFPGFGATPTGAPTTATPSAPNTQPSSLGLTFTPSAPTIGLTLPSVTPAVGTTTSATPFTLAVPQPSVSAPAPVATTTVGLTLPQPTATSAPTLTSTATISAAPTLTTSAAATTTIGGATVGPKTAMKFGELEQLVASRRAELEQAGRAFIQLAAVLANRDAELRRSAVKLVGAEAELDRLRMTAETLDRELDYADTQTTELEGVVDDIERQLVGVGGTGAESRDVLRQPLSASSISAGAAGGDRASTLQMAVAVDAQLRASARQLRSLSERVNSINGTAAVTGLSQRGDSGPGVAGGASSGMAALTRLLDSQLRLLEWAESNSSQLQRRIDALSNRVGSSSSALGLTQTLAE